MTTPTGTPTATAPTAGRAGILPWAGVWRQTLGDAAPLAVGMVVVAAAAFLSAAVPQAIDAAATAEVSAALGSADAAANLRVTVPVNTDYGPQPQPAEIAARMRDEVDAGIPAELRGILAPPVTALVGPELKAGIIADRQGYVRFIYVSDGAGPAVSWIEGRAPKATSDTSHFPPEDVTKMTVEVAVSDAAATLMGVHVGAKLPVDNSSAQRLDVEVSGIFRADDPDDDAWSVEPNLLTPKVVGGSAAFASVGLLTSPESLPYAAFGVFPTPMTRTYTYRVVPSPLDARRAAEVSTQARSLASGRKVFNIPEATPIVTTHLDRVIDDALARVASGTAQSSVLLIGLLSVALLVQLLAAGLVVERRTAVLTQWRARGSTLPAIGLAGAAESVPLALVAGLIGMFAATRGGVPPWAWVTPTLVAAALPQPILAIRTAARASGTTRPTAGTRQRFTAARVRRLAAEVAVGLVALASLATLVLRGVTAAAGSLWSDAVVLAAPVLVALAVALALTRLQPPLLAAARDLAVRSPGAVPLLAAARTRAGGLATTALVTATAIAAIAATIAPTVVQGRVDAAWDAVGADAGARLTGAGSLPPTVSALDGTDGLIVATATTIAGAQAIGPQLDRSVTIVAVDAEALARLVAATPTADVPGLGSLASGRPDAVSVLVPAGQGWDGARLRWGEDSVTMRSVGAAPALPPSLDVDGPAVVVDRRLLGQAVGHDIGASQAWVAGPDAEARLVGALGGTGARVVTRPGWLAEQAARPVTRALGGLFVGAGAVALALGALAVALLAASGSRARTIALAQLRAAGTPRAAAARVAWLEVAVPTVVAGAVGIATGLGLAGLLVVALDLTSVTGGLHPPALVIPWWTLAIPIALGLVARVAVALAALSHRAERLGLLMRAG